MLLCCPLWSRIDAEYNVGLNLIGSFTGQCAQTAIAGVALRLAPVKLGASFMAIIGGITSVMGILGNVLGGQLATVNNNYIISFIAGAIILFAGCLAVPFLGANHLAVLFDAGEMVPEAGTFMMRFDRNVYGVYNATAGNVAGLRWPPNNNATFAAWQVAGEDADGIVANPQLTDPRGGDFTLQPGSPDLARGFVQLDLAGVGPRW